MSHHFGFDAMAEAGPVAVARAPVAASLLCARWAAGVSMPAFDDLQADWWSGAAQLVQAHGGRLRPGARTELSASFAAGPGAANQAARALYCGLALLAAAHEHEALARKRWPGLHWALSVGVHSTDLADAQGAVDEDRPAAESAVGGVVGGAVESSAWQVVACIADAAPPGRLSLCHDSAALVRGAFDVEPMLPMVVQPGSAALQVGLLGGVLRVAVAGRGQALATGAPRSAGGDGLIGRRAELLSLQQAYAELIERPAAAALTVVAEAGVGKSRLLAAFDAWAQAQPQPVHTLHASALPQTQAQPFGLLRLLLCGHCRIGQGHSAATARLRLEQAIVPWFVADDGAAVAEGHAHSIAHLIGIDVADSPHIRGIADDPRQIRQRAVRALGQWLRGLSAAGRSPVLLRLDDLHWADDESLDLLHELLRANGDTALLVLASSRAELGARRAVWLRDAGLQRQLALHALSPADGRLLALAMLARLPEPPPTVVDRLTAGSGGHPQFIVERVQLLIDQGVLLPGVDFWSVDRARLRSSRLPTTLVAVLKARLALLPSVQRQALQLASVIGPSFSLAAWQALGAQLAVALPMLLDRSWAVSVPVSDGGRLGEPGGGPSAPRTTPTPATQALAADSFAFKHASLQQAAYASLPRLTRRELHGRLARWLVAASMLGSPAAPAETAAHFEQAGEDLLAAEHHVRAAQYAATLFASDAVLRHVQRGLEALQRLPAGPRLAELRWQLLRRRVGALEILGGNDQYEQDIVAIAALADALDDDSMRTEAASIRCGQLLLNEDYAGLKSAARQSMALAERAGLHDFRVSAMRMLADAHCGLGDWDAGARLAQQALSQARALDQHSTAANCLNTLAAVAERQQDPLGRVRCHEQALALSRQIGDRRGEATQLVNLAGAWLRLGELVAARQPAEQALVLARSMGARVHESLALSHSATLALWLGQTEQGSALAQASVEAARAAGSAVWQANAQLVLGAAALARGDDALAELTFEQVRELTQGVQVPRWLDAITGLARVALRRGDVAAAMALVQQVFDREAATQSPHDANSPRSVDLVCHRVLANAGDGRAQAWLQRAHGELMVTASAITDARLREGFFNNIPDHRAILAAWRIAQDEARCGVDQGAC